LHRRPAERARGAIRGRAHRWRRCRAPISQRHAPQPRADVLLRRRRHDDRLLPVVRRAVRDDAGRSAQEHNQPRVVHVHRRLSLVAVRQRGGDRVRAVHHHPRVDHPAAAPRAAPRMTAATAPQPMRRRVRVAPLALHAALIVGALLALFPLFWMISASFMPTGMANQYPPHFVPHHPTFAHYREIFTRLSMGRFVLNSAIIALAVTSLSLFINSAAGYAFAKLRFRGRDSLFRGLMLGLVVPVQVAMLPLFLLFKEMRLINTYWGVIIPSLASIFGIFLIRQYTL